MSPEETLTPLGFTETEALAYCELLRAGPSTGYRIAQGIGKAQANTYKALSILLQKGAIIDDGGDPRSFRALAPEQLVAALNNRFAEQTQAAAQCLAEIRAPAREDRLYQLRTPDQVWTQAKAMIDAAQETVLFDCFPKVEERLAETLERAARRGVLVRGVVYDETRMRPGGYEVVRSRTAEGVLQRWPGAELRLASDASQHLLALLSHDLAKVRHALWSDSVYLSVHQHYALAAELRLHALAVPEPEFAPQLSVAGPHPPGLRSLLGLTPAP
jgi:predicted transcriptional regulator